MRAAPPARGKSDDRGDDERPPEHGAASRERLPGDRRPAAPRSAGSARAPCVPRPHPGGCRRRSRRRSRGGSRAARRCVPSRSERSSQRHGLVAASGARERPPERVVAVDRRPLGTRLARERDGLRRADAVVGAEDGATRGRRVSPLAASSRSITATVARCARRRRRVALPLEQVAEQTRRTAAAGRRSPPAAPARPPRRAAARGLDPARCSRARRTREDRERGAHVPRGCVDAPAPSSSLASSTCVQAVRLGDAAGGVERQLHRRDRAGGGRRSARGRRRSGRRRRDSASRRPSARSSRTPAGNARARSARHRRRRTAARVRGERRPRDRGRARGGSRDGSGRGCRARASRWGRRGASASALERRSERGRNDGSPVSRQRSW